MEFVWQKNYPEGVAHEIDNSRYSSINDIMETSFRKFPHHPSFHNMGSTLTYSQLSDYVDQFASFLQNELQLKKGDRVALMMPNILQYPIAMFGVLKAGCVVVNVNPLYTARELEHQLKDSEAETIVIFENSAYNLEKILTKTKVKHVLTTQIGDMLKFPKNKIVNFVIKHVKKMVPSWHIPQAITFNQALTKGSYTSLINTEVTHDDLAFLQYTGGTTGVSKGAELTHGNIVSNVLQAKEWIQRDLKEGSEVLITPLPLYHIFSLTANCIIFSAMGAQNILITNPRDIPGFIKELKKWKFTSITAVNTLFNALVNHEDFKSLDFSGLRIALGGGMAVQKGTADKWKKITGCPIIEAYGLTETSPAACINPITNQEYNGFIGLPIPSTEVKIKTDDNKDLAFNEIGEICIKGPQVMRGYWKLPEETANVMTDDGFFKTGDMGFMNEDGYIKIVDRKKDMILVSGFNVYPNEIEDALCTHEKILECAAIGVADAKSGEAVKVFVVKKDDSLTEEEVKAYAAEQLTNYKRPRFVEFRESLPKTNVGKILRKDLR